MSNYFVSIYHPMKGWAPVFYGPKGPEYTGSGHSTPQRAYEEAKIIAQAEGVPLAAITFGTCPVCNDHTLNGRCDTCTSKEFRERIEKIKAARTAGMPLIDAVTMYPSDTGNS